ncbi:MAG TPA: hypothetical protein VGK79_17330 [Gaiellaceae bacterium]
MLASPPAALTVSPTRIVVAAGERRTLEIANNGTAAVAVVVSTAGYAVGLRGTPRVAGASGLLAVRPRRVTIPPGGSAAVLVSPVRSAPRDRAALVLVASRPTGGAVGVSVRIGVLVLVRGTHAAVHRVVPVALRVRGRRWLELSVRNLGTASERLSAANVRFVRPAGVRVAPRELLPRTRGIVRVRIRAPAPAFGVVRILGRTYRLRVAGRR